MGDAVLYDTFCFYFACRTSYATTVTVHAIIIALVDVPFLTVSHARAHRRRRAATLDGTCQYMSVSTVMTRY